MDEELERQRRKYIRLKSRLNSIKRNVEKLDSKTKELVSTLNSGFKIDSEIAEKETIDSITKGINNASSSIGRTISIANRKI